MEHPVPEPAPADVLLLDGFCGLCTRMAFFLKPRLARPGSLRFVGQESAEGEALLATLPPELRELDTVVLFRQGTTYVRSAAILRTGLYLRWWWKWMVPFGLVVPRPLRDLFYRVVARNRRKWFKPPDRCML